MPHRVQFNTEDIDHSLAPYWTPLDSEDDTKEQKSAAFQAWLNKKPARKLHKIITTFLHQTFFAGKRKVQFLANIWSGQ